MLPMAPSSSPPRKAVAGEERCHIATNSVGTMPTIIPSFKQNTGTALMERPTNITQANLEVSILKELNSTITSALSYKLVLLQNTTSRWKAVLKKHLCVHRLLFSIKPV